MVMPVTSSKVRAPYAAVADLYVDQFGSIEREHEDDLAFIRRHFGGLTGPVLDLGCGTGRLTGYLRSLGVEAMGIDLVPGFIDHARTAYPGARFEVGAMTALEAVLDASGRPMGKAQSMAGLLAWYSLIHLGPAELNGALAGFRRILAPGGILVVGVFDGDDAETFEHKVITARRRPAEEVSRRLIEAGFVEVDRLHRPADGARRPHAALAARAGSARSGSPRITHVPADSRRCPPRPSGSSAGASPAAGGTPPGSA